MNKLEKILSKNLKTGEEIENYIIKVVTDYNRRQRKVVCNMKNKKKMKIIIVLLIILLTIEIVLVIGKLSSTEKVKKINPKLIII